MVFEIVVERPLGQFALRHHAQSAGFACAMAVAIGVESSALDVKKSTRTFVAMTLVAVAPTNSRLRI
jgi:hypothetical protein